MKYVTVNQQDNGGTFCMGIFSNYKTAIGDVMDHIWDFQTSYQDEGDTFEISAPYTLEGGGGTGIKVTFKAAIWESACSEYYYILDVEDKNCQ